MITNSIVIMNTVCNAGGSLAFSSHPVLKVHGGHMYGDGYKSATLQVALSMATSPPRKERINIHILTLGIHISKYYLRWAQSLRIMPTLTTLGHF